MRGRKMIVVNNILTNEYESPLVEFLPDKYIVKNVLQNKLKCNKIVLDKSNEVLKVFWVKEYENE